MTTISYSKTNKENQEQDTVSLDSFDCIDLSFEDEEPEPQQKTQKEVFKTIYGLGRNADRQRLLEQENAAARAIRILQEKEEAERNAFKEQVFTEHEVTTAYSTQSSFKAGKVREKMVKTIRANKEIIPAFDRAVEKFNKTCTKVIEQETNRIEEEKALAEAIEANAGKELDFFQEPTLLTRERFGYRRANTMSCRLKPTHKASKSSLNAPRTNAPLKEKPTPKWNI